MLHYKFEPNPKPLNCCTYSSTKSFAEEPDHPLHIRTRRRLAAFNPNILHWTVKCPLELSKKAVVRNWSVRRVKEAFKEELRKGGWDKEGKATAVDEEKVALKGALCIHLNKNKRVVEASGEEVRTQCSWVLRKVVEAQGQVHEGGNGSGSRLRRATRKGLKTRMDHAKEERQIHTGPG